MKIFAFEFFSGGGLIGQPLPQSIVREGDLMLRTLVGELTRIPGVEVITSQDPRLPPIEGCETLRAVAGENVEELFARGVESADAVWPTAPEAGGTLEDGLVFSGGVVPTADDTISLRLCNFSAAPIDGAARTWSYLAVR